MLKQSYPFRIARQKHDYSQVQELELRCDGIAVITLLNVGVNPENLISAITKLNKHNERPGSPSLQDYVAFKERITFIRSMVELLRVRRTTQSIIDAKKKLECSTQNGGGIPQR